MLGWGSKFTSRLARSGTTTRRIGLAVAGTVAVFAVVVGVSLAAQAFTHARSGAFRLPAGVLSARVVDGDRLVDPKLAVAVGTKSAAGRSRATARTGSERAQGSAKPQLSNTCDVSEPEYQFVTFPDYPGSDAPVADDENEICGMWALEDAAEGAYASTHGYTDDGADQSALFGGVSQEAGYVESMLEDIAKLEASGATLTADQQGAYDWFEAIEQEYDETVADDALAQYNDFVAKGCNYKNPDPKLFSYDPMTQSICVPTSTPSLEDTLTQVSPPTTADFVAYGTYLADQSLAFDASPTGPGTETLSDASDQPLIQDGITEGAGVFASLVAGGTPYLLTQFEAGSSFLSSFIETIAPFNKSVNTLNELVDGWRAANLKEANAIDAVEDLKSDAGLSEEQIEEEYPDLFEEASDAVDALTGEADIAEAAIDTVVAGASELTGPLVVATIAITFAVQEGIQAVSAAQTPVQLMANQNAAEHPASVADYVAKELSTESTAMTAMSNVEAQFQFPKPTVGTPESSSCTQCKVYSEPPALSGQGAPMQLKVAALNPDGSDANSWSETESTAPYIDTWPMGATNGEDGVPEVSVGLADGEVWTEQTQGLPSTDETQAGLSGYLPSGEFHYFNAAGDPMIAYIDGDHFKTVSDPGSNEAAGLDGGNYCTADSDCTTTNSIVVMADGGTPQLQDQAVIGKIFGLVPCSSNDVGFEGCSSDTFVTDGKLVPAGGDTVEGVNAASISQQGTSQLYRLTIVPDTGTPAVTTVANQYNTTANDKTGSAPPDGGLVAGQTATFADPDVSAAGYSTTYEWQIQSLCSYDPTASPQYTAVQDVPVCADDPNYTSEVANGLPDDDQDLASCAGFGGSPCSRTAPLAGWVEDPDFGGDPVTTLTGQSVNWTWPAPGIYHVRLITTDQYGVQVTSDQNLTVSSSSPPTSTFSYSAASGPQPAAIAPSVVGPVVNGDAFTVTGCVNSPDTLGNSAYSTPEVTIDWGDGDSDDATAPTSADSNVSFTYNPASGCSTPWEYQATHTYSVSTSGQPFIQEPITVTIADVTEPVTPSDVIPAGTHTSSSTTLYADIYASQVKPSFVSGASTSYNFTAASAQTVTGYVNGPTDATITDAAASGVTQNGTACSAGLPGGVAFQGASDNSFQITGTANADAGGCYAINVTATNDYGSATEQVIVDVLEAPTFTSSDSASLETGDSGSVNIATTGFPAPTISVSSISCSPGCGTSLPSDLTVIYDTDGTATISGTPGSEDSGVYTIHLAATNSAGSVNQTLTLTIEGALVFTSADTAAFATQQGGTYVHGAPTGDPFTVTVTGAADPSSVSFSCTIASGPDDGDPCVSGEDVPLIDGGDGGEYGLAFTDNGNSTASISGAPYASGAYTVTLKASDSVSNVTQTLTIYVSNTGGTTLSAVPGSGLSDYTAPSGQTPASATAKFEVGTSSSVTLCSNDPSDTLTSQSPLPAGLQLTDTGSQGGCPSGDEAVTISGTPTSSLTPDSTGSTSDRIVDAYGGLELLTIDLDGSLAFSSAATAPFTEGTAGSFTASVGTISLYNGNDYDACLSESGRMAGLTFTDNGNGTATISGTPSASGSFPVTLTATNCNETAANPEAPSESAMQQLTIDVQKAPSITSAASAGFHVGAGGTFTVTTNSDAYPTPALSVGAGSLPAGVTFTDNGDGTATLSVAPDAPQTASAVPITITAASAAGQSQQTFELAVGSAPTITSPASSPTPVLMTQGAAQSFSVTSSAVPAATLTCTVNGVSCSPANLPAGLSFTDNGNGTATVSGTPSATGSADVTITAANTVGDPASTTFDVSVDSQPAFAGTTTGGSCASASASQTADTLVANSAGSWTVCGSGVPAPAVTLQSVSCGSNPVNLPPGLEFVDNRNGSATLSGTPAIGSGAACPGGYKLAVAFANGLSTVVQDLNLSVQEVIAPATPSTAPAFVAGAPNKFVLGVAGSPTPQLKVSPLTPLPAWLKFKDGGNATATVSGEPPAADAGKSFTFTLDATNSDANELSETVTVAVSKVLLKADSPTTAKLGRQYRYALKAPSGTTFALAHGSGLPSGLKLARSGVISGTPTEIGKFPMLLKVTHRGVTARTGEAFITVTAPRHALEVSQFRTIGPKGQGDWFVQVINTTKVTLPMKGWHVGVKQPGSKTPLLIALPSRKLKPGATELVASTEFSLRKKLSVSAFGPATVPIISGFEIVAPNGAIVDVAGVRGAIKALKAGHGVHYASKGFPKHEEYAFVRRGFTSGHLIDTGHNSSDFKFGKIVTSRPRERR